MSLKRKLLLLIPKRKIHHSEESSEKHERKGVFLARRRVRVFLIIFLAFLFLHISGVDAQAPDFLSSIVHTISPPKPITKSNTALPVSVQSSIENLAKQEISAQKANETLPGSSDYTGSTAASTSLIQPFIDNVQLTLTINPVDKEKLRLKQIDRLVAQLESLLANDRSDGSVSRAVSIIANVGRETGKVATDPKTQADREVLTLLISQYNRVQVTLQKVEDTLPMDAYLKVESARVKYLLKPAQDSLNNAPNLDVVNNIGLAEVKKIVGDDFAELKAIEILTDLESGLNPGTQEKLTVVQRELATQFEKRMLKLPADVRLRKLSNYINFSYGNPVNQVKAFDRMQDFLTDREVIVGIHSLKELALKKLSDKILTTTDDALQSQFFETVFKDPGDLEVVEQMQLQKNDPKLESAIAKKSIDIFGRDPSVFKTIFAGEATENANLLDVATIARLQKTLESGENVDSGVKAAASELKKTVLVNFLENINQKGFGTVARLRYNPAGQNADVRLLIPNPGAVKFLNDLKADLSSFQRSTIDRALLAAGSLASEHVLSGTIDPEVFNSYVAFLNQNPATKQLLSRNLTASKLEKAKEQIVKIAKAEDQKLFETVQQITQDIFLTDNKTSLEKLLPDEVQQEISKLKSELGAREIPQLALPDGVTLPAVAKLPDSVESAIITAAADQIKDQEKPEDLKLNLDSLASDLGDSVPSVLPDSPLYLIKEVVRVVELVVTIDPVSRADALLAQDNEKTLEAAKLIENSQSQESISLALETLNSVNDDFNKLKEHSDEVVKLAQIEPEKVDELVSVIIDNGLARQTVFSEIENNVHGDAYVAVEEVRSQLLASGIDALLKLTSNDVQGLTEKLETAVSNQQGGTLSDIKAVELLNEIGRTQPEETQQILQDAEAKLTQNLETKLLAIPEEKRIETVLAYADNVSGNAVRQFEAYEVLKDNFTNPAIILLTEGMKEAAVFNLTDRIEEIPDAATQQDFVDKVIGSEPQDLKVAIEIEAIVAPLPNASNAEVLPIVQKVEDIKASIEQNIIESYKDKPEELASADFFDNPTLAKTPDVADLQVVQDLQEVLGRSDEVTPEVIAVAKEEGTKIIDTFIENVSSPEFQASVKVEGSRQTNISELAAETLNPVPETIAALIDLKDVVSPTESTKIDLAIKVQVELMQEYLTTEVTSASTLETYIAQIAQDPVVAEVVARVGGSEFQQAIETVSQTLEAQAEEDHTQLVNTVAQVQKEIFTAPINNPSAIEETLPQVVQDAIQQIKEELPVSQIPAVEVEVAVQTPTATPKPAIPVPAESAAPEVKPSEQTQPVAPPPDTSAPAPAVGL